MNCSQRFLVCLNNTPPGRCHGIAGLITGGQRFWYSLSQQVFEACVQFYVILVQVTKELVCAEDLCNSDQLENTKEIQMVIIRERSQIRSDSI